MCAESKGVDFGNYRTVVVSHKVGDGFLNGHAHSEAKRTIIQFFDNVRYIGDPVIPHALVVTEIKRMLGLKYDSNEAKNVVDSSEMNLVRLPSGYIGTSVSNRGSTIPFRTEQFIGAFIREMVGACQCPVISIPPCWSNRQRTAMMRACEIGGIANPRLINSSLAISLSYWALHQTDVKFDANIAFVDFGDCCLSVSIASVSKSSVEILATTYDETVGFALIVDEIVDLLMKILSFDEECGRSPLRPVAAQLLKEYDLMTAESKHLSIMMHGMEREISVNRADLAAILSKYLTKTELILHRCLSASKVDDVHSIEVASSLKIIQNRIEVMFPHKVGSSFSDLNPFALGCCIYYEWLGGSIEKLKNVADCSARDIVVQWVDQSGISKEMKLACEFCSVPFKMERSFSFNKSTTVVVRDSKGEIGMAFVSGESEVLLNFSSELDHILQISCPYWDVTFSIEWSSTILPQYINELRENEESFRRNNTKEILVNQARDNLRSTLIEYEELTRDSLLTYIGNGQTDKFVRLVKEIKEWEAKNSLVRMPLDEYESRLGELREIAGPALRRRQFYSDFWKTCGNLKSRVEKAVELLQPGNPMSSNIGRSTRKNLRSEAYATLEWLEKFSVEISNTPRCKEPPISEKEAVKKVEHLERVVGEAISAVPPIPISPHHRKFKAPQTVRSPLRKSMIPSSRLFRDPIAAKTTDQLRGEKE